MDLLANMDLRAISASLVALIVGAAIGWLVAHVRLKTKIAELNTDLILERRVNKQLSETLQVDAVPQSIRTPVLTTAIEPAREPSLLSG